MAEVTSGSSKICDVTRHQYIGWVPCLSGDLIFTLNTCALDDSGRKFHVNHMEVSRGRREATHYIVLCSTVNWKDSENPDEDGRFRVLLVGERSKSERFLIGNVYVMLERHAKERWAKLDSILQAMQVIANNERDKCGNYQELAPHYDAMNNELAGLASNEYMYKVGYELDKYGFVGLSYCNNQTSFQNQHCFTVTRQCYYYIKYSFHTHQHHPKSAESLTTIHTMPSSAALIGELLLDDLRISLVQLKQNFQPAEYYALYKARGITSYTQSLLESCRKKLFISEDEYKHQKEYFKNIETSLQCHADNIDKALLRSTNSINQARAVILFIFAIIAPITILYKEKILKYIPETEHPEYVLRGFSTVFENDRSILITLLITILFIISYRALVARYSRWAFALRMFKSWLGFIIKDEAKKATLLFCVLIAIGLGLVIWGITGLYHR